MNISLVTELPFWFIIFCIIIAAVIAFLFYWKDEKFKEANIKLIWIMSGLRFLVIFFISFLLLSPLVKSISTTVEKPIIIIAQDNSESILFSKQNNKQLIDEFKNKYNQLISELSKNYTVKTYSFGDSVKNTIEYSFSDKHTDFSELFSSIQNNYYNRNVGALIIASDGIYNKGENPLYLTSTINFPVYTIGLGDTTFYKDLYFSHIKYNKTVLLGNQFPIVVNIEAKELDGAQTELKLFDEKQEIYSKPVTVYNHNYNNLVTIELEAKEKGIHHYRLQIKPHKDEINTKNNFRDIIIEVIDNKQNILILQNSPHPDISAIRSVLDLNQNFETEVYTIDDFNKPLNKYNLLILHQLPSNTNNANTILADAGKLNIPVLFIAGTQTNFQNLSILNLGISIHKNNLFEETDPQLNEAFNLFEMNDALKKFIKDAPPLYSPFGDYQTFPSIKTLIFRKIKNFTTKNPLIAFNIDENITSGRVGFILGEGIWRWRLYNYKVFDNHNMFNELINKIVQLLISKESKNKFNIIVKNIINENEPVIFDAEIFNDSYELINKPEIWIDIFNKENKKFSYQFSKINKSYTLHAGNFLVGDYMYKAKTKIDDKEFEITGKFAIIPINIEQQNTIANHHLLFQLAQKSEGKFYLPNEIEKIKTSIETNKNIFSVSYSEKNMQEAINYKWLFFILMLFISAEWFLRKFLGSY